MFYRDNTTKNTGLEVTFTFLALVAAIVMAFFSQYFPAITPWILLIVMLALLVFYLSYQENIRRWVEDTFILQMPCDSNSLPSRREHDFRRNLTYPPLVPNAWYHLCDASDLPPGKVLEFRACNQVFVVWRGKDGIPVCQDAYCLHQGANLGVGGTVVDDNCLQCPFHFWKFDKDGNVVEIPYNSNPKNVPKFAKLKTYPCVEWCGWICVYYHADGKEPEYQLPAYVPKELKEGNFKLHLKWNAGHRTTNVIDLVDQVCDHAHFNLLHGEFIIPWTLLPMPAFLKKWLPLGIRHELTTFQGDDKDWKEAVEKTGWGEVNKYLLYFYDKAGITWNGKLIETTLSQTTEMYIGPSLVVFHIPIPIGELFMTYFHDVFSHYLLMISFLLLQVLLSYFYHLPLLKVV